MAELSIRDSEEMITEPDMQDKDTVTQTDSRSVTMTNSNDSTNLRLDTVIKIKSDLSMTEEKKDDDEASPKEESAELQMARPRKEMPAPAPSLHEAPDTPVTEAESMEVDNANEIPQPKPSPSVESKDVPHSESQTSAAEGMTGYIVAIFGDDDEEADDEEAEESTPVPEEATKSKEAEEVVKKEEEAAEAVAEEEEEAAAVAVEEEEEAEEEKLASAEQAAVDKEVNNEEEEESKLSADAPGRVDKEDCEVEALSDTKNREENKDKEKDEAGLQVHPTITDDSDKPMMEAQVTTRATLSMDSVDPMAAPVMSEGSAADKSTKSVHFAEETFVNSLEEAVNMQEADDKRDVSCWAPLCGTIFDVEGNDTPSTPAGEHSLDLEEEAEPKSEPSTPATQHQENDFPDEAPATKAKETADSSMPSVSKASVKNQDPAEDEGSEKAAAVTDKLKKDAETKVSGPEKKKAGTKVEAAISPADGEKANTAEEKKDSDVIPGAEPPTPIPSITKEEDKSKKEQPVASTKTEELTSSPVGQHLKKSSASFDYQPGMTCTAVFSCGIMPGRGPGSPRHIPLTHSKDFILDAREETEKELEARSGSGSLQDVKSDSAAETAKEVEADISKAESGQLEKEPSIGESPSEGVAMEKEEQPIAIESGEEEANQINPLFETPENSESLTTEQDQKEQVVEPVESEQTEQVMDPVEPEQKEQIVEPAKQDQKDQLVEPIQQDQKEELKEENPVAKPVAEIDSNPGAGGETQEQAPIPDGDKAKDPPVPDDLTFPMTASKAGVIVEDLDAASKAQAEAYACGCTIL